MVANQRFLSMLFARPLAYLFYIFIHTVMRFAFGHGIIHCKEQFCSHKMVLHCHVRSK